MLRNRSVQVKFVKTPKNIDDSASPEVDLERVGEIIGEQIANTAFVVVGSIVAVKIVDTLCKIAINVTNPLSWR